MNKREMKRGVNHRREELRRALLPQWKRCFWTRPFGHIRDGTVGRNHYRQVCVYCGKPAFPDMTNVKDCEKYVAEAHLYSIANGVAKNEVRA